MSSGFIYFVRLLKSYVIYARSHCTIVYFDLGFLHFLEDTKTSISQTYRELGFSSYFIWSLAWYFVLCGFCGFGVTGVEKGEKCAVIFAQRLFLLSLPVPLNTIERVLLSDTPSPLLLSSSSLLDPTSTNI